MKDPALMKVLLKNISATFNLMVERVINLQSPDTRARLVKRLHFLARRFGVKDKSRVIIDIPLNYTDIALSIGTTRETVNRLLKRLEKEGILEIKAGTIIISKFEDFQTYLDH